MSAKKISCNKVFSIAMMAESKKGHNFAVLGSTKNKIRIRLFFVLLQHIKFQDSTQIVFQDTVAT